MVFRSKIDIWLITLLCAAVIFPLFQAISALRSGSNVIQYFTIFIILSASFLSLTLSTKYTVTKDELLVQSGLFKWRIDRNQIIRITPSKSIISSPALSLDRLRIDYEHGRRSILISPKDQGEFLKAIAFESNAHPVAKAPNAA